MLAGTGMPHLSWAWCGPEAQGTGSTRAARTAPAPAVAPRVVATTTPPRVMSLGGAGGEGQPDNEGGVARGARGEQVGVGSAAALPVGGREVDAGRREGGAAAAHAGARERPRGDGHPCRGGARQQRQAAEAGRDGDQRQSGARGGAVRRCTASRPCSHAPTAQWHPVTVSMAPASAGSRWRLVWAKRAT